LGGTSAVATAINNDGAVVGYATLAGGAVQAFLYNGGVMSDLGTLATGTNSIAYGINNLGDVVGWSHISGSAGNRAMLYRNGAMSMVGSLAGTLSEARDINDSGQVIGEAYTAQGHLGFLYSNGVTSFLPTLGGNMNVPYTINNSGQVAGYSETAGGFSHAYLYSGGIMQDLGTLGGSHSYGRSLNESGHIVGYSDIVVPSGERSGFLYLEDIMYDLNDLIAPGSLWHIRDAIGINNRGQIAAWGCNGTPDGCHALLLTAEANVAEPSSLALLGLGLAGIGYRRRKRAA